MEAGKKIDVQGRIDILGGVGGGKPHRRNIWKWNGVRTKGWEKPEAKEERGAPDSDRKKIF